MYLDVKKVNYFNELKSYDFNEPILIVNGCNNTNAKQKWNLQYLNNIFKDELFTVEVYKTKDDMMNTNIDHDKDLLFNEAIEKIMLNKSPYHYIAEFKLDVFKDEIKQIIYKDIYTDFDNIKKSDEEILFLGYDSYSGCHIHANKYDYILNQIIGKKNIIFI